MSQPPLLLFDGECGLCNRTVAWVLRHETRGELQFAPLQGETAQALRNQGLAIPNDLASVVLVRNGSVRLRTSAIVGLAPFVRQPWRFLLRALWLVPAPLRDLGYRMVARVRYRIWGTVEMCAALPAETRRRLRP